MSYLRIIKGLRSIRMAHHQLATTVGTNPQGSAMTIAAPDSTAAWGRRSGSLAVLVVLALGLAGCGSLSDQMASTAFVAPGKFDLLTCEEIENQIKGSRARVLELEQLMARSEQGTGGQFVSAIAYQSEYAQTRGRITAMTEAIASRNCRSQSQWSSGRSVF